ncbi:hypothetical protein J3458_006983 [Metarhizium acridum]|uniref:uncharacterized protein n=1 Tax=Metarhizium acridum TaxID=92637 RepID=UPI001C6D14FD|nr:hypothetical protein J3458_006983 [Metarhizium acridum]
MHSSTIYVALAAFSSTLVQAHSKISVATGDAGGNTTALGIMGAVVPRTGPNGKTELDSTVFGSRNAASDGLGRTTAGGKNSVKDMVRVAGMSGSTLPQVSSNGGSISATYHVVTTDGGGPVKAIIDPSGTGKFSQGTEAEIATQVPGKNGNIAPGPEASNRLPNSKAKSKGIRDLLPRILGKRAQNVNQDFDLKVNIPAGTTCQGTVGDQQNVCLLKVANPSRAGPFGGVLAFQMVGAAAGNSTNPNGNTSGGNKKGNGSTGGNGNKKGNGNGTDNGNATGNKKGNGNGTGNGAGTGTGTGTGTGNNKGNGKGNANANDSAGGNSKGNGKGNGSVGGGAQGDGTGGNGNGNLQKRAVTFQS